MWTTLKAQRLPRRVRREWRRATQRDKESAVCTKKVVGAQPMHRVWWSQFLRHVRPQSRSPARPLPCASTTGCGASAKTAAAAASASTSGRGASAKTTAAAASASTSDGGAGVKNLAGTVFAVTSGRGVCVRNAAVATFVSTSVRTASAGTAAAAVSVNTSDQDLCV